MAQGDVIWAPQGSALPLAGGDPIQTYQNGKQIAGPGDLGWSRDAFGKLRMYQMRRNLSGSAMAAGELASKKRLIVTNLDSGTTLTAVKAATFGTSPLYVGAHVVVHDDAGGAGAAPEGESTIVASHDAATLTFDTGLPLSAALALNDDITVLSLHVVDSADGDFAQFVAGVVMAAPGDGEWGWFQLAGVHPRVIHTAAAVAAGEPVVADAAKVGAFGTDAATLWVGYQVATHAADVVSTKSAVNMSLFPAFA